MTWKSNSYSKGGEDMTITNCDNTMSSTDPKLEFFHKTKGNPRHVICVKDNPKMYGFGRILKIGDMVEIDGTVWNGFFAISVPSECAFYDYTHFEPCDDFFNR